jgi:branched-chain amino acid transport system ATP-binding protein
MLKIEKLNVAYGDVQVLWDVNMEVADGKIVALVGSNAAGKSTTINTISGLNRIKSGSIIFNDHKLHEMPAHRIPSFGVLQVPEGRKLFSHMSVKENLELGAMTKEAKGDRKKNLEKVYELLPVLKEKEKTPACDLSGGQQQMAAIGRALMGNPKLLMVDELSLGLAPILVEETFKIIRQISQMGTTILLVEQNVKQSLAIADYGYVLENGRIVMQGVGGELLDREDLKKAYLGM